MSSFILLVAIVGKERNGTSWVMNPSCTCTHLCNICTLCQKCNLYPICPGTHVSHCIGDGSWCRYVGDDSSWAVPSIDVVLLIPDANPSLVVREMPVWATYIQNMYNTSMHNMQTIHNMQKIYTNRPCVNKLHIKSKKQFWDPTPVDTACGNNRSGLKNPVVAVTTGLVSKMQKIQNCKICYLRDCLYYWA